MPNLNKFINDNNIKNFFVLDSKGGKDSKSKYADNDYRYYCYNTKRFNRLKEGAIFLYRRPGRINKDRKFEIVGGGIIGSIIKQDDLGNVKAFIENGFKFTKPLKQGDPYLENMEWTSKTKKEGWGHFWNQYGMNQINKKDFINLVKNSNIFFINKISTDDDEEKTIKGKTFKIVSSNKKNTCNLRATVNEYVGHKVNFLKLTQRKMKIGDIGECIVLNLLQEKAKNNHLKQPVQVSKSEGDGLGYDIRSYDKNGHEKFIEVKTTTTSYIDGFDMSKNEISFSQEKKQDYEVYRLFNLNTDNMTVSINIYRGPFNGNKYHLEPLNVKVYLK